MDVTTHFRMIAVLALLPLLAGCGQDEGSGASDGQDGSGAGHGPSERAAQGAVALDEEWWRRKPPISLYFTGGQRGKLEPCGCSDPMKGGLRRAASVLQQLRRRTEKANGALAALSLGWTLKGTGEAQSEAKADLVRAVHESLGYSATLLGATDLTVDAMCQPRGEGGPEVPHPPINVMLAPVNPAAGATPFVDMSVRNLKIRAVSVLEPDVAETLETSGFLLGQMSVSRAFEGLEPRPDTLWIVAADVQKESTLSMLRTSLRRLGACVIVDVTGGDSGAARHKVDRFHLAPGGEPLIVALDDLGKALGVLDVQEASEEAGWIVSFRRIDLVPQWEDDEERPGALVRAVDRLEALYGGIVRERGYLERFPRYEDGDATYVGSAACAECHAAVYLDWKQTAHARALETLEARGYHWDAECIRCHVVGWRRSGADDWIVTKSAFRTPERTPFLGGVGCESCHGPGSAHIEAPMDATLFDESGPNVAKPGRALCETCHDVENSHGFAEGYKSHYAPLVDHHLVPADRLVEDPEAVPKSEK